jgi:hypothetical protein
MRLLFWGSISRLLHLLKEQKLLIVDGIKIRLETDEDDFWNGIIEPSISGDIAMLSEWIIRGVVELETAIEMTKVIIPLLRQGYSIMHHDPEGRISVLDPKLYMEGYNEAIKSESWKDEPQPVWSKHLSAHPKEVQDKVRAAAAETDAKWDWSQAMMLTGYSDREALSKLSNKR